MKNYTAKMPNGMTVFCPSGDADEHQEMINRRDKVVRAYCQKQGWPTDATQLSIDQILQIRATDEWKNAGSISKSGSEGETE